MLVTVYVELQDDGGTVRTVALSRTLRDGLMRKLFLAVLLVLLPDFSPAAHANQVEAAKCRHALPRWRAPRPLPVVHAAGAEGVVLPAEAAPIALCPCRRRIPVGASVGYWTPSEATIAKMERALPDAVQKYGELPSILSRSRRQYVGVIRHDHRAIYVNLFPKEHEPAWRSKVVRECVWDNRFFGVEYDVDAGTFTHIAFQGTA
jgi:hypothetical protein